MLSRLKRARLALNVSDLWPESAVALGVLKNRRLIQAATGLEEFLYRNSDVITGQTNGIVTNIQPRFGDKSVTLIPNGVDTEHVQCRLEHGILDIRIPVLEASKPKQIQIQTGVGAGAEQKAING